MSERLESQPDLDEIDTDLQQTIDGALQARLSQPPAAEVDIGPLKARLDAIQTEGWQRKTALEELAKTVAGMSTEIRMVAPEIVAGQSSQSAEVMSSVSSQMATITTSIGNLSRRIKGPSLWQQVAVGLGILIVGMAIGGGAIWGYVRDPGAERLSRLGAAIHSDVAQGKIPRQSVAPTYKRLGLKVP